MAVLDLNEAGPQGSGGVGVIPPESMVFVKLHIEYPKPDVIGTYPELTRSTKSSLEFLSTSLEVTEGKYKGAKIYHRFSVLGAGSDKQQIAVNIAKNQLRAIVEFCRRIDAKDSSPTATQQRVINSYTEFEGMVFPVKVGCEASNTPKKNDPTHYYVNNSMVKVVTVTDGEYATLSQPPYEIISALPVPEVPVGGAAPAASASQQVFWGANKTQSAPAQQTQQQAAPQAAPQAQMWNQAPPAAAQTPPPAPASIPTAPSQPGTPAPSWAAPSPAPAQQQTDVVPF